MLKIFRLPSSILFCMVACYSLALCQTLKVVTEDWRPYNFQENEEVKGKSTEVVKQILNLSGFTYTITVYPWARSYQMAQENENILIYTLIRIAPREKLFKWIAPLGKGGMTSLYKIKTNKNLQIKSIEDAKNVEVVANLDSMDHIWLKFNGFNTILTPPKVEFAVKMLFSDRAQLLAFDDAVIKDEFKNAGYDAAQVEKVIPLFQTPPYLAASLQTSDEIVVKLQKAYQELLKNNKIKAVN